MSKKQTIFVTVLGDVAEVDWDTVPDDVEVEVVDLDSLKATISSFGSFRRLHGLA